MKRLITMIFVMLLILCGLAWAGTKTPLFTSETGIIDATDGTFTITDVGAFVVLKVDGLEESDDHLDVLRDNYAGNGWLPFTNGSATVQMHKYNTAVTITQPGTYCLSGVISATITAYTEE